MPNGDVLALSPWPRLRVSAGQVRRNTTPPTPRFWNSVSFFFLHSSTPPVPFSCFFFLNPFFFSPKKSCRCTTAAAVLPLPLLLLLLCLLVATHFIHRSVRSKAEMNKRKKKKRDGVNLAIEKKNKKKGKKERKKKRERERSAAELDERQRRRWIVTHWPLSRQPAVNYDGASNRVTEE